LLIGGARGALITVEKALNWDCAATDLHQA
jgi:hypothetical protein